MFSSKWNITQSDSLCQSRDRAWSGNTSDMFLKYFLAFYWCYYVQKYEFYGNADGWMWCEIMCYIYLLGFTNKDEITYK